MVFSFCHFDLPNKAAQVTWADTRRYSRSRYLLHLLQSGGVGRSENLNRSRLDIFMRLLRPFIGALDVLIESIRIRENANNCKLRALFVFVTKLSKRVWLAVKNRLDAILIMFPEFFNLASLILLQMMKTIGSDIISLFRKGK
jgi:hypothetical protein